jgi:hypothetical protein
MNKEAGFVLQAGLIGVGATIVMDIWALVLKHCFKIRSLNWGTAGRWLGHFPKGVFIHASIANASPVRGEATIGWLAHYTSGIVFALILIAITGPEWLSQPTPVAALIFGLLTVIFPFFIMQPGMGAGIVASKTPNSGKVRFRSLLTHLVFCFGLYVSALFIALMIEVQVNY